MIHTTAEAFCRPPKDGNSKQAPDGLMAIDGPISRYCTGFMTPIKTGAAREGVMFSRAELQKFLVVYAWAASTEEAFMNIIEELKGQYDTAEQLWSNYRDRLKGFRSEVKNDLTSIEAAGRKVTGATERMLSAYGGVLGLLNSPQMVEAVNNAERLAEAMERLSKMSAHRLVFEVADETKSAR